MNWKPIKVQLKTTGEMKTIKDIRFDSRIHKFVSALGGAIDLSGIVNGVASTGDEKEVSISPAEPSVSVELPDENPVQEVDLASLKFTQLKTLAKEKGLVIQNTTKKAELLEMLKNA